MWSSKDQDSLDQNNLFPPKGNATSRRWNRPIFIISSSQYIFCCQTTDRMIEWKYHVIHKKRVTQQCDLITENTMKAVRENKYALKGPLKRQLSGKGYRSMNVTLRKRLQLYANVRPCFSIKGVYTPYQNVNVVTIRENTQGEYSGLKHEVVSGVVENKKILSYNACKNIAEYAFEYARANQRKQVVACQSRSYEYERLIIPQSL